ncbi:uncharacterized protein LOC106013718 [Aplysia californica]|uniref:Uncharacterized protein LOC106013718 n=1 Tax=Aplysia californica TaxID=6500 RepID=A0ABM1ADK4_APLCA|nr:uncharacterized protein LOC106013718 [Aplysia californica]
MDSPRILSGLSDYLGGPELGQWRSAGFVVSRVISQNLGSGYPSDNLKPPFLVDEDRYTLSAYFVHPSIICTTGRTVAQVSSQGLGSNLYIQTTQDPDTSLLVPRQETNLRGSNWTEGQCFFSMGRHYWYDLEKDMNCGDIFPVFLLYNGGQLTGFGWAMVNDVRSVRYEHPPSALIRLFIKNPPRCLFDAEALSAMHIYLNDALFNLC